MREIKFRAWDKTYKIMTEVWDLDYKVGKDFIMVQRPNPNLNFTGEWRNTKEHIVLMQYTGLKDKNGKEIYEGDIVNYFCGNPYRFGEKGAWIKANIFWDKGCFRYQYVFPEHEDAPSIKNFFSQPEHIEIIGNIWENPELIK